MARLRKTSAVIQKAETRVSALSAVDPTLDLGGGLSLALYEAKIEAAKAKLHTYNQTLATLDALLNDFHVDEKELNEFTARMLAAVGAIYGKDSNAYEQAGGKRASEIKR